MAGTRWVRLDVDYFKNPKVLRVGTRGALLHLVSICWSASQLTDGHIPATAVPMLCHEAGVPSTTPSRLVEASLWMPTEHDFYIKDYLDMNPSRGDIEAERERWRLRQREYRNRRMSQRDSPGNLPPT